MTAEKGRSITALQIAITDMDCMAAAAFKEIALIAGLVLTAMENPDPNAPHILSMVGEVLTIIRTSAQCGADAVNCAAEVAGCEYTDERAARHYRAERSRAGLPA